ncbi:MAG: LysR family transcriptional regulator [Clostridiales Family XIII bacterium]|nr:LysR family transcriptional regulator [Clostridiales Family XIII bacterium]
MNIQQLHYFDVLAQYLNFSEASKHLFIAQPALSHSIACLETELKIRLFQRDTRSVRLTAAGTVFLHEVREILGRLDNAIEKAHQTDAGFSGSLNIGFLSTLIKQHFPDWIPPFQEKYPNLNLHFEQMYMAPLREALEQEFIDVAFTRSFDLVDSPTLQWIKIYDEKSSLILREDHPLAQSDIDFKALAKEPFIIIAPHISPYWHLKVIQICANRGFTPHFAHRPLSMETVYALLDAGLGVAILPNSGQVYNKGNLTFIDLEGEDAKIDVVIAWKKNNLNPAIPLFLDTIIGCPAGF